MFKHLKLIRVGGVAFLLMLLSACGESYEESRAERIATVIQPEQLLGVGIVWTQGSEDLFMEGVRLAFEESQVEGGVLVNGKHRRLELIVYEEPPPQEGEKGVDNARNHAQWIARQSAYTLAAHPNLVAVIGHEYSSVAIPASVIYEKEHILYVGPSSSMMALTQPGFFNIFRTTLNNEFLSEQLAAFCYYHDLKRLIVLNVRNYSYSEEMADTFSANVAKIAERRLDPDFKVVFQSSFFKKQKDLRGLLGELKLREFDAVFIPVPTEAAINLINQSYELNIQTTFIGEDELAARRFARQVISQWLDGGINVVVPVGYNPASNYSRQFIEKFTARFGMPPDGRAARGYDSFKLLVYALENSSKPTAKVLANTLRFMSPQLGATGIFGFDLNGELYSRAVYFKKLGKDGFFDLRQAHLPFLFERLEQRRLAEEHKQHEIALQKQKTAALAKAKKELRKTLRESSNIYLEALGGLQKQKKTGSGTDNLDKPDAKMPPRTKPDTE